MNAIYVEIIATRGSTPRDAGTAMKITPASTTGTIGGGALEYQAIAHGRDLLESGLDEETMTLPLGPALGQCCGGSVTLHYTRSPREVDAPLLNEPIRPPSRASRTGLWLWGAGHVGRAVANACPLQVFDVTWVDTSTDRFPQIVPHGITVIPAADMPRLAAHVPRAAHHLIFTYAHDIDLGLCAALLDRGAASIGVIGSSTKWSRFSKRLRGMGLDPTSVICPIGNKSQGKHPAQIADGAVRALVALTRAKAFA